MKLFEYCIIMIPDETKKKEGQRPEIVIDIKPIIAKDIAAVNLIAGRQIPDHYMDRLDEIQVVVRPF